MANCQRTLKQSNDWPRWVATFAALFAALIAFAAADRADAVTIVLKNSGRTIRATLVRKYATGVVVDEVKSDGTTKRIDIPLSDIDLILDPIDRERLASLKPGEPQSYRNYAEELAEIKADPDARATAIRLYLIAAHLDRDELGTSSLLGMAALARSSTEQRRFQAMVYLLDAKHDRRLLTKQKPTPVANGEPTDASTARVIQAMQYLRQGKIKEAKNLSRREGFKDVLAKHAKFLTFEEFEDAANPRCPQCESGKQECPMCSETGRVGGRACPACYGRRKIKCLRCDGNYKEPPLPRHLLRKVLLLELELQGESHIASAVVSSDKENAPPWSRLIREGQIKAAPALRLETLTEFDPRANVFRDGEWRRNE